MQKKADRDKRLKSAKRWARKALKVRDVPVSNVVMALICAHDEVEACREHMATARAQLDRRHMDNMDRVTCGILRKLEGRIGDV